MLVLRPTYPNKDAHSGCSRKKYGVSGYSLHRGMLCCPLKSVHAARWRGNGITLLSPPRKEDNTAIQEAFTEEQISSPLMSQASFRTPLSCCLSEPSAGQAVQCSCVLCQVHDWILKTPNYRDPVHHRPMLILWGRFTLCCGWCLFVPEKQSYD